MKNLLTSLCAMDAVSGAEDNLRAHLRQLCEPFADKIIEDAMGNLFIFKYGRDTSAPRTHPLVFCAHMDEVGLMVTDITAEGFLRFGTIGAVDVSVLLGKRVRLLSDTEQRIYGVIGLPPIHLSSAKERGTLPALSDLRIDIGATDRAEAELHVTPGDFFAFDTMPTLLGADFLLAKAIDDRLGCAVLLKLIWSDLLRDTWFCFTVQEETGARGAQCVAAALPGLLGTDATPTVVIVESTTAADTPDCTGANRVCAAGEGVVLATADKSARYDAELFEQNKICCETLGIPLQIKRKVAGGTDASAFAGCRVAGISAAVRGIHSPGSVVSLRDAEHVLELCRAVANASDGVQTVREPSILKQVEVNCHV